MFSSELSALEDICSLALAAADFIFSEAPFWLSLAFSCLFFSSLSELSFISSLISSLSCSISSSCFLFSRSSFFSLISSSSFSAFLNSSFNFSCSSFFSPSWFANFSCFLARSSIFSANSSSFSSISICLKISRVRSISFFKSVFSKSIFSNDC